MADKKFLDQSGVTTLWKKIKNNIEAVKTADEARIKALEDNDKVQDGNITVLQTTTGQHTEKLSEIDTKLTGLDQKIVEKLIAVVNEAPADYDTLKEIAAYIESDKTDAANINTAISKIKELLNAAEGSLDGLEDVDTRIENALKTEEGQSIIEEFKTLKEAWEAAQPDIEKISELETTVQSHTTSISTLTTDVTKAKKNITQLQTDMAAITAMSDVEIEAAITAAETPAE